MVDLLLLIARCTTLLDPLRPTFKSTYGQKMVVSVSNLGSELFFLSSGFLCCSIVVEDCDLLPMEAMVSVEFICSV